MRVKAEVEESGRDKEEGSCRENLVPLIQKDLFGLGHSSEEEEAANLKSMTGTRIFFLGGKRKVGK